MNWSHAKYIPVVFLIFAGLFAGAYYYGSNKYDHGEGLATSTESQLIVHYYLKRNKKQPVDIRAHVPAERVAFGQETRVKLKLANLSNEPQMVRYSTKIDPEKLRAGVNFFLGEQGYIRLEPHEKKVAEVVYELSQQALTTANGTLSLYFDFSG